MKDNKYRYNNNLCRVRGFFGYPFYRRPLILSGIAAICILVIGFSSKVDLATGMAKTGGKLEVFRARDERGISVWIQETNGASWGFVEWPDKGCYGFFETENEGSNLVQTRCQPASSPSLLISFRKEPGGESIRGNLGDDQGGIQEFLAARDATPLSLGLWRWLGTMEGAKIVVPGDVACSFSVTSLVSGDPVVEKNLDRQLRKGRSAVKYARLYWNDFNKRYVAAARTSQYPGEYDEKQYALWNREPVFSCALQRRLDESEQGSDTSRGAVFFSFSTFNVRSGETLSLDDLLVDGWEKALTPLLTREMVRVTDPGHARPESANGAPAATGQTDDRRHGETVVAAPGNSGVTLPGTALRGRGFFEDTVAPSDEYFLCRSGLGFYYAPYSLAPASKGDFVVVIPWAQLGGLLKEPFLSH